MAVTDVTPCNRVKIYWGCGGNCCSSLQVGRVHLKMDGYRRRWKQQFSSQILINVNPSTRLRLSKSVIFKTLFLYAKGNGVRVTHNIVS